MNSRVEHQPQANIQYWGAFMDEALNFSINSHSRPSDRTPDNIDFQPCLAIYGDDRRKLEVIQGGIINGRSWNLNDFNTLTATGRHQEWYLVTGNSVECLIFLRWVRPFLAFKQAQAEIFEEFLLQKREVRRHIYGFVKVPSLYADPYERMVVEREFQERLYQAKQQVAPETSLPTQERLAATLDADMSLGLYRTNRGSRPEFLAKGNIVSVRYNLLEALFEKYGGVKPTKKSGASKTKAEVPSYKWEVNGEDLLKLLTDVKPYLYFKKSQAEMVIEFLRIKKGLMANRGYNSDPLIRSLRNKVLQVFLDEWPNIDPLPASAQGES
ncbi:hypothetical protein HY384_00025 [Candidatus Daviesbacteria bacterium]|nr:hypothetical protein [Candidatus Daviesbacteria bacterium]